MVHIDHNCGVWSQLWHGNGLVTIVSVVMTLLPWCGHNCVTKCNYGEECDQPASGDTNSEIEVINQLKLNHCITDTVAVQNQSWQTSAERKSLNTFWPQWQAIHSSRTMLLSYTILHLHTLCLHHSTQACKQQQQQVELIMCWVLAKCIIWSFGFPATMP